jgi:glycosyltransferase involved in cell wall biosynthesis
MTTPPAPEKAAVVLIGNYPADRQESMLRFQRLLETELAARGYEVHSLAPFAILGRISARGPVGKWLAYVDKYLLFPPILALHLASIRRRLRGRRVVVHICDHANAVYASLARRWFPVLVTCHDLLAVRGARGEDTYCPASGFGKYLQAAIFRGIGKATFVACVSEATRSDLIRLGGPDLAARSNHVPLATSYPYRPVSREQSAALLAAAQLSLPYRGFVLHVGSDHPRKNRRGILLAMACIEDAWTGPIVFAGDALSPEEREVARKTGLHPRVVEVKRPSNETLLALYNTAHAQMFLSYAEGFGWPILEAQASGCPVIASNRTSVPEVAGPGAPVHGPEDYAAIGAEVLRLGEPAFREEVVANGLRNAASYSHARMMDAYEALYARLTDS